MGSPSKNSQHLGIMIIVERNVEQRNVELPEPILDHGQEMKFAKTYPFLLEQS